MTLTREESLELENIALRKQVLSLQAAELQRTEAAFAKALCARLGLPPGTPLACDPATGVVTVAPKAGG